MAAVTAAVIMDGPSRWPRRSFTVQLVQGRDPQGGAEEGRASAAV